MTILLREQAAAFLRRPSGLLREGLDTLAGLPRRYSVSALVGVRRCGKTVLLRQLSRRLGESRCHYCDLEDERLLGFSAASFDGLIEALTESFGERRTLLLDGLTAVPDWKALLRRARERRLRVVFTAAAVSSEVPHLRLHPYSFREFVRLHGASPERGLENPTQRGRLRALFARYLSEGGMPAPGAYERVLYRDIAARHGVRQLDALRGFLLELTAVPGRTAPFSELKRRFGLGSLNTLKTWLSWTLESGLLFAVPARGPGHPRLYCADHALVGALPRERALENAVALELLRRGFKVSHEDGVFVCAAKGRAALRLLLRDGEVMPPGRPAQRLPAWEWLIRRG